MLGRGVNDAIRRYGPAYPFRHLRPLLQSTDLRLVNLECAITTGRKRYAGPPKAFYFLAEPAAAESLALAGVDFVSLANNHTLDADSSGLADTLHILGIHKIAHAGAGINLEQAREAAVLAVNGLRLAIFSCCDHQQDFAAGPARAGIWHVDIEAPERVEMLAARISRFARDFDHVIVAFHWMPNWVSEISPQYRSLAGRLVDAGATLIWGHSPHHFQGVEWMGDRAVLYSTGGLIDDYAVEPEYRNDCELIFAVQLDKTGVVSVRAYPIQLEYGYTQPAAAEHRAWIRTRFAQMCTCLGSRVRDEQDWLHIVPADATAGGSPRGKQLQAT